MHLEGLPAHLLSLHGKRFQVVLHESDPGQNAPPPPEAVQSGILLAVVSSHTTTVAVDQPLCGKEAGVVLRPAPFQVPSRE